MGSKYEELDQKTITITTSFADGVAIATRSANGDIDTILADRSGAQVAQLKASAASGIQFREFAFPEKAIAGDSSPALSADWANVQIYRLWQEAARHRGAGMPRLLWDGDYLSFQGRSARRVTAPPSFARANESEKVLRVVSDFGSIRVKSERQGAAKWTARLTNGEDHTPLVEMTWFDANKTLVWTLPDGTKGAVQAHTIPGGWPFRPSLAWANLQAYAFYESWRARLASRWTQHSTGIAPPMSTFADMDGCTGLHWLDNTIFRECCDEHDRCYIKQDPDCSALSWIWPGSWHCLGCNLSVVWCLMTGGGDDDDLEDIGGGGDGSGSPIVFDLGGRGFAMSGMKDPVRFDLDNDKIEIEATGWTERGSETGFLCLDLDHNGSIDDGSELFGNHTRLADGSEAKQGFQALAQYDENANGEIDASDAVYGQLRIWIDSNHDGRTDSSELLTLENARIVSIGLEAWLDVKRDRHGNEFRYKGVATRLTSDGQRERTLIYDVFLVRSARRLRDSDGTGF